MLQIMNMMLHVLIKTAKHGLIGYVLIVMDDMVLILMNVKWVMTVVLIAKTALEGVNSLVETHELLLKEWSINNTRKPSEFLKKSTYIALWNCPTCHNDYPARICDREVGDDSCPYCNNRKALPGFNSFMVNHNDLMEEWDFINNYLLCNPDEILDTYSKDVWWNCKHCKTKYLMSLKKKIYYQFRHMKSCPYCKGLRRKKKYFF
jgi:rubrerythrin